MNAKGVRERRQKKGMTQDGRGVGEERGSEREVCIPKSLSVVTSSPLRMPLRQNRQNA